MNAAPDRTLLGEVSGFIAERMGLRFPEERWSGLARGLEAAGRELGFEHPDAVAHFLYATICHELGRIEDAIAAMGKVLYLDQDFILAHHALGSLYKRHGKRKESRRHIAVALELLSARGRDEIVPESDGMTCGRLVESIRAMTGA